MEIVYKEVIQVFMDGKHIGDIRQVPANSRKKQSERNGFEYKPKNGPPGDTFLSVHAVKQSLEEE